MNQLVASFGKYGGVSLDYHGKKPILNVSLGLLNYNEEYALIDENGNYLAILTSDSNGGIHETAVISQKGFLRNTRVQLETCGRTIASSTFMGPPEP
jgi:hypothetical protein